MSWDAVDTVQTLEDYLQQIRTTARTSWRSLPPGNGARSDFMEIARKAANALNCVGGEDGLDDNRPRYCVICAGSIRGAEGLDIAENPAPTHERCQP